MATVQQKIEGAGQLVRRMVVTVNVVDGAAAGTFVIPRGAVVDRIARNTPVALPGTPTAVNLRLGSAANGQQFVADVDLKGQGYTDLTLLHAIRNAADAAPATVHFTVATTGGTAADVDGVIRLNVFYAGV